MIKLLKYDWKRNATTLLGAAFILLVLELASELFITDKHLAIVLQVIGYVGVFVVIVITTVKTYGQNIASYSRRLLPVHPVTYIFSPMILGLLSALGLGLIFLLHNRIREQRGDLSLVDLVQALPDSDKYLNWGAVTSTAIGSLWTMFVLMLVLFAAVTIGRSFRVKGQPWIIIISYLILENGFGYIQSALGLHEFPMLVNSANRMAYSDSSSVHYVIFGQAQVWGSFIYDVVFSILMIVLMVVLINRRVEVKQR